MFYDVDALKKRVNLQLLSDLFHCITALSDNSNAKKIVNDFLKTSIYPITIEEENLGFLKSLNLLDLGEFLNCYQEKGFSVMRAYI